jgi:hypothetical protein
VRLQDATLQQLLVDYQNTVLKAQQQVDDGISTFLQSRVQVGYLRRSVTAAEGALRVGTEQYEQGATDFTTVLTAEQNLFQAQSNLAAAYANVALGATAIYRALGGGWQIREDSYFVTAAMRDQMGESCCSQPARRNRRLRVFRRPRILDRQYGRPSGEVRPISVFADSKRLPITRSRTRLKAFAHGMSRPSALFGESPSATLRRAAEQLEVHPSRPFAHQRQRHH